MPRNTSMKKALEDVYKGDNPSEEVIQERARILRATRIWANRRNHCEEADRGMKAAGLLEPDPIYVVQARMEESDEWTDLDSINGNRLNKYTAALARTYGSSLTASFETRAQAQGVYDNYVYYLDSGKEQEWREAHATSKTRAREIKRARILLAQDARDLLRNSPTPTIEIPDVIEDPAAFAEQAAQVRAEHQARLEAAEAALREAQEAPEPPVERYTNSAVPWPALRIISRRGSEEQQICNTLPKAAKKAPAKKAAAKKAPATVSV